MSRRPSRPEPRVKRGDEIPIGTGPTPSPPVLVPVGSNDLPQYLIIVALSIDLYCLPDFPVRDVLNIQTGRTSSVSVLVFLSCSYFPSLMLCPDPFRSSPSFTRVPESLPVSDVQSAPLLLSSLFTPVRSQRTPDPTSPPRPHGPGVLLSFSTTHPRSLRASPEMSFSLRFGFVQCFLVSIPMPSLNSKVSLHFSFDSNG